MFSLLVNGGVMLRAPLHRAVFLRYIHGVSFRTDRAGRAGDTVLRQELCRLLRRRYQVCPHGDVTIGIVDLEVGVRYFPNRWPRANAYVLRSFNRTISDKRVFPRGT